MSLAVILTHTHKYHSDESDCLTRTFLLSLWYGSSKRSECVPYVWVEIGEYKSAGLVMESDDKIWASYQRMGSSLTLT